MSLKAFCLTFYATLFCMAVWLFFHSDDPASQVIAAAGGTIFGLLLLVVAQD